MRNYGVVLVSHGGLSAAVLETLEMLMGPQQGYEVVSLMPGMGREDMQEAFLEKARKLDAYPQLLVLCDLVGGSPCNVVGELLLEHPNWHLVGGVNMALVCELAGVETLSAKMLEELVATGREAMGNVGAGLRQQGELPCKKGD